MTGCNFIGKEELARRKTHSDNKNDTDALTFENDKKNKKRCELAKSNKERMAALEMNRLLTSDDASELTAMMKEL